MPSNFVNASGGEGPGIMDTIVEVLLAASEDHPTTKRKIHDALRKRFPNRSPDSMWNTICACVPTRVGHNRDVEVYKNAEGMWAVPKPRKK